MAEQNTSQTRQQSQSYPSPHSYPSPSMQPTYTYPPPQGQGTQEPYRASPTGSNMSLPSLNLPPIRLQDGQGQPPQQHQPQQPMGSPLPPPVQPMSAYYPNPNQSLPPPGQQMNVTSSPHQLAMRYQLPPHQGEPRMMSGGRHKKEIKRRTKTGCLTCRKRRIKCDEAHPTCRNCQKSKRECMGYDPIFKQQPGPAQIQPAPSAAPLQPSLPASAPPASGAYAHVPQGYAPAATAGYAPPAHAPGHPPYDQFNSAIDPALAATDPALQGVAPPYNGQAVPPGLRAGVGSASPYSSIASDAHPIKAKRIKISDTFSTNGHAPPPVPPRTSPVTPEEDSELTEVYTKDYVNGLCHILETDWFITNNNGLSRVMNDKDLHEEALFFVLTCRSYNSQQYDMANQITSQEIRLVWRFLSVCRQSIPPTNGVNGSTAIKEDDSDLPVREVRGRLEILEALLTNDRLESNPLLKLSYPANIDNAKKAQVDFWAHLGDFVVNADNEAAPPDAVERSLAAMRDILQQIEARDVIYSIAIARVAGNRVPGFPHNLQPPRSNDPNDDVNKLNIAKGFITDESKASTQQVITRICEMALTSWKVSR